MLKIFYRREDSQLRMIKDGKQEVLTVRSSPYYYVSENGDYVIYRDQAKHFPKEDLYILFEGKKPKQVGTNVHLIHVSPEADLVLFIDKYANSDYQGSLYMIENGEKKTFLDRNVSGTVIVIEKGDRLFKVLYTKYNKNLTNTICVIDETGKKHVLGKKFKNIRFYATKQDEIRTVAEVERYKKNVQELETYVFHDEQLIGTNLCGYRQNDSKDTITFNEETVALQQEHFRKVYFHEDSDDIVFQFANHTSSRYFIANEIAKRAKWNVLLESPYEKDDSINHLACFSMDQVEDILLLHYTLTTGIDFLFSHKLFGVNVEQLVKHTGAIFGRYGTDYAKIMDPGFMDKDTMKR
ncbi:hypothetical protein [Alkalihalobacterium alkalinitrilicum]|uniref:hypothetical protein n=1 Tax=Alkalihalobacterium alkalinitrilicum TaxID=427920 RepID=UPI000994BE8F|nr:hypothetical protein [Alkalihalobacterium alkalinitrilicum]